MIASFILTNLYIVVGVVLYMGIFDIYARLVTFVGAFTFC